MPISRLEFDDSCVNRAGLALPVVVPPVREALGFEKPTAVNPPPVRQLIEQAKK